MNLSLLERVRQGDFARVRLDEDTLVAGYLAADPKDPGRLRLDSYLLSESGHLQQVSLSLLPEEILQVQFLPEPPEFFDAEGQSILMERCFFRP